MTRQAHSVKHNPSITMNKDNNANNGSSQSSNDGGGSGGCRTQYEIGLLMNSPRSEIGENSGSDNGIDSVMKRK
ncbi:hypothetical protein M0R45_035085 [Rubus argutus]|uniref:Uncharacterized protein n=1 Tax=Rubus argutus TaxID=59490 RepID=A0AAW1VV43_RUBAR